VTHDKRVIENRVQMLKSEIGPTVLFKLVEVGIHGIFSAKVRSKVYGSSEIVGQKAAENANNFSK
jgi:hypothetical protein